MDMLQVEKVVMAPKSWKRMDTGFLEVFDEPWYEILMEIENEISVSTYEFYAKKNMKTLHLPITTGTISSPMGLGSDSSPVKVNLCGVDTYLADSMQFMLEYGCRIFSEGCYYLMPSFRGELADERHLCQFYHSEAEIIGGLEDVMNLVEEYVIFLSQRMLERQEDNIYRIAGDVAHIEKMVNMKGKIPRIRLLEAVKLLGEEYPQMKDELFVKHDEGFYTLTSLGEKKLIEHFGGVVWLTHFEHLSLPFYQAFEDEDEKFAMNADLLFGIGETVGCGERHEFFEDVEEALDMHEVSYDEYKWYLDMKKERPLKTAGFGMGIERFILWLFKHDDIRDCQVLPRFNGIVCMP